MIEGRKKGGTRDRNLFLTAIMKNKRRGEKKRAISHGREGRGGGKKYSET